MTKKITQGAPEENSHWKNLFPYEYLGAFNLSEGEELIAEIASIDKEMVTGSDGSKEALPVLHFAKDVPKMILNKTNSKNITKALGTAYTDKWVGRSVQIFATKVQSFGQMVEAVRIRDFAPKVVEIDVSGTLADMDACSTAEELKTLFSGLSLDQKGDARVIAKKDALKQVLK